jgi:hypothetical protein
MRPNRFLISKRVKPQFSYRWMLAEFSGKIPACKVHIPSRSEASTSAPKSLVPTFRPRACCATYVLQRLRFRKSRRGALLPKSRVRWVAHAEPRATFPKAPWILFGLAIAASFATIFNVLLRPCKVALRLNTGNDRRGSRYQKKPTHILASVVEQSPRQVFAAKRNAIHF